MTGLPGSQLAVADLGWSCHAQSRFGKIDIGAFESQGFHFEAGRNRGTQLTLVNHRFNAPLVINVLANDPDEPANGGVVNFNPYSVTQGTATSFSDNAALITHGQAMVSATANSVAGRVNVVASATGSSSLNFQLTSVTPSPAVATQPKSVEVNAGDSVDLTIVGTVERGHQP